MAPLAATLAIFGCLALGTRMLTAVGGGPSAFGGGDAIGSLPFSGPLPPEAVASEAKPSIVLEGPSYEAIHALVLDAYGDGYVEVFDLSELGGGVRVEFQGHVTVVLDRTALGTLGVTAGLDVSQGFSGGMAILTKNQHLLRTQGLPVQGDLALPLQTLAASGVLDSGQLALHSISLTQHHHLLGMSCSGGTLRLVSGD